MPLSGTFDTMQLSDLIQWIHTLNKSGTLTVSIEFGDSYLVFREGNLILVSSVCSVVYS